MFLLNLMRPFTGIIKESLCILAFSLVLGIAVNGFRAEGLPLLPVSREVSSVPQTIQAVLTKEAEQIVRAGKVSVIDLRPLRLFEESHLPGAVSMPVEKIYSMTAVIQEKMPRERGILLYGMGVEGKAVEDFAAVLQMMGYGEIYTVTEKARADGG